MISEFAKVTIPQIIALGLVLISVIAALAIATRYVIGRRRFRLKAGATEAAFGAGCDCSMREIIMSTHRLTLAQTDALDVLLVAINGRVNGEVAAARKSLQKARTSHAEEMAEVAAAGGSDR